jgi:hypothetical protein
MRFFLRKSARRIRAEDAIFSARRYTLRKLGFIDGRGLPVNGRVAPWLDQWPESEEAEIADLRMDTLVGRKAPPHWK